MKIFNFGAWNSLKGVSHAFGRTTCINESEEPRTPKGMDPKEVEAMERRVKEEVNYAIARLSRSHPFFAGAAVKLKYVYTYRVKTAATDGAHIFINPMFFSRMNSEAVQFVIMHEILHCMLMHFLRMDTRNRLKWNYATDYEINLIVSDELNYDMESDPVLKDGLYDKEFRGMSAEHIYDVIDQPKDRSRGGGGSPGGGGTPSDEDFDDGPIDDVLTPEEGKDILKEEGIEANRAIKPTKEDWEQELKKAAQARARSRGGSKGTGGPLDSLVDEVLRPKVDWKKLLKKMIGTAAYQEEYRVPSKRYIYKDEIRSGIWSSSGALQNVVFAMDVSGSMIPFVKPVFTELSAILKADKVYSLIAVYFDTIVTSTEKLERGDSPDPKAVTGGGGTLFVPVIEWINKNVKNTELVVILSDGENADESQLISMKRPKWAKTCIWVIIGNPTWTPPFGKVIHVPADEFTK